ncbi:outer membrane protein assembly factor BamB family protein [Bacillus velezensis]|uniref:outer membrane protein assembly factor BamB family protein n=1 Tax=Bacillus velezensis TaxID=492670 RepID=UPI001C8B8838|nr:PQQ-binding-like beta-propeller repeat protein [Bacillus velezensis]
MKKKTASLRVKTLAAGAAVAAALSVGAVSDLPGAKWLHPAAAQAAETVFKQNHVASGFLAGRYDAQAMSPTMFNWSRESRFTSTADGALKWEKNVPANPQNGAGAAVDRDGTVFIQSKDGKLTAYHPDGTVKWVTENLGTTYTLTPVLGTNGVIYLPSHDKKLYFIDKETGNILTSVPLSGAPSSDAAIGSDGTLYVSTLDNYIYAIKPTSPSTWTQKWKFKTNGVVGSAPVLASNGTLYTATYNNIFYAINSGTGQVKWSKTTSNGFKGYPVIDRDGTVYAGNQDGNLYAYTSTGAVKWTFPLNGFSSSSLAIDHNGNVYIGSGSGELFSISKTGNMNWSFYTDGPVRTAPLIDADGNVYFGSDDKNVYAVDADGNEKWRYQTDSNVISSPVLAEDGTLYVGTYTKLLAFGAKK